MRFDVQRFVDDLGGPRKAAEMCEVSRTTPYRWLKTGRVDSNILKRAKAKQPTLNIDAYFPADE